MQGLANRGAARVPSRGFGQVDGLVQRAANGPGQRLRLDRQSGVRARNDHRIQLPGDQLGPVEVPVSAPQTGVLGAPQQQRVAANRATDVGPVRGGMDGTQPRDPPRRASSPAEPSYQHPVGRDSQLPAKRVDQPALPPEIGYPAGEVAVGVDRRRHDAGRGRIDQHEEAHVLAPVLQLPGHLEGDPAAGTVPTYPVRTPRLHLLHLFDVVGRHLFDRGVERLVGFHPLRLEDVERLVGSEVPAQLTETEGRDQEGRYIEERAAFTAGLDRYQRRPGSPFTLGLGSLVRHAWAQRLQRRCQASDRGRSEKNRQRRVMAGQGLDLGEHAGGEEGVSAEVEEVVVAADAGGSEDVLPDPRKLALQPRPGCLAGARRRAVGSRQLGAIDLVVGCRGEGRQRHVRARHHVVRERGS